MGGFPLDGENCKLVRYDDTVAILVPSADFEALM